MTADELPSQRRRRFRAEEDMEPRPPRDPWKVGLGILSLEAAFALLIAYASEAPPRDVVVRVALPAVKLQDTAPPPPFLAQILPQSQPAPPPVIARRSVTVPLPAFDQPRITPMTLAAESAPLSRRGRIDSLPGRAYTRPLNDASGGEDSWEDRLRSSRDQHAVADRPAPQAAPGPDGLTRRPGVVAGDGTLPRPRQVLEAMAPVASGPSMTENLALAPVPRTNPDRLLTQPDRPLAPDGQELPWIEEPTTKAGDHPGDGADPAAAAPGLPSATTAPLLADDLSILPATPAQDSHDTRPAAPEPLVSSPDLAEAGSIAGPGSARRADLIPADTPSPLADASQAMHGAPRPDDLAAQPAATITREPIDPRTIAGADPLDRRALPAAGGDLIAPTAHRALPEPMAVTPSRPLTDTPRALPHTTRPDGLPSQPIAPIARDPVEPRTIASADALDRRTDSAAGSDLIAPAAGRSAAEAMMITPERTLRDPARQAPPVRSDTLARPTAHRPPADPPDAAPRPTAPDTLSPSRTVADAVLARLRGRGSGETILTSLPTALADPGTGAAPTRPDGLSHQPAGIGPSRETAQPLRPTGPDRLAQQPSPLLTDVPEDPSPTTPTGDSIATPPPSSITDPAGAPALPAERSEDLPDGPGRRLLAERAPPSLPATERLEHPATQPTQDPPRPASRPGARGTGIDQMASSAGRPLADTIASPWQAVERLDRAATLQREAAIRPVAATPTADIGIGGFDVHAMFDYGRHLRGGGTQVQYLPYGLAHDARSLAALFDGIDYAVGEGAHIPGVFLRRLPRDIASIPGADDRKMLFVRAVLPLIVHENEKNLTIRQRVLKLAPDIQAGTRLSVEDQAFIDATLVRFRMPQFDLIELLARIDVIPPSLALAQAAEESGWGTSRMAREGNALFGEVMWRTAGTDENGKVVREQRPFDDLATGVEAYMRNLNTHRAYGDFRRRRAAIRASGGVPDGHTLAPYLLRYSERGGDYVQAIRTLIELNNLVAFDSVRFRAGTPRDTTQIAQPPEGARGSNSQ